MNYSKVTWLPAMLPGLRASSFTKTAAPPNGDLILFPADPPPLPGTVLSNLGVQRTSCPVAISWSIWVASGFPAAGEGGHGEAVEVG